MRGRISGVGCGSWVECAIRGVNRARPVLVVVADDSESYRRSLVRFLSAGGAEVLGQATSGVELLAFLEENTLPDVAILDAAMAGRNDDGLLTAREIAWRHPTVAVLLLSAYREPAFTQSLFEEAQAGRGYMIKESLGRVEDLMGVLSGLIRGENYCDPNLGRPSD